MEVTAFEIKRSMLVPKNSLSVLSVSSVVKN